MADGWRAPARLLALALFVFAVVALAGPGRIDIIDGQVRYEVARSLVDHGDDRIRDPDLQFHVFDGRGGDRYTDYRFPHSVLGAPAVWLADVTGPRSEERRHFFFVLVGAVACSAAAVAYAVWFRSRGASAREALGWALAGVLCMPLFFYGTSTFDDALGTAFVLVALVSADAARRHDRLGLAAVSGLALLLAVNSKPPLGIYLLPAMALAWSPRGLPRLAPLLVGALLGVATFVAYDYFKFPPETRALRAAFDAKYVIPTWHDAQLGAISALLFSPGTSFVLYAPPVLIGLVGWVTRARQERLAIGAMGLASAVFFGVICSLTFFTGDPAWGPRYLTPMLAAIFLWAPDGARALSRPLVGALLGAGLLVQLLALTVDPHRLYIHRSLPTGFYTLGPHVYFEPSISHLLQRPAEIVDVARAPRAPEFTPAKRPTYTFPIFCWSEENPLCVFKDTGPEAVARYQVLNGFRPWWSAFEHLPAEQRPVQLGFTFGFLLVLAGLGAAGMALPARPQREQ